MVWTDWLIDWLEFFDRVSEASFCSELHTFIKMFPMKRHFSKKKKEKRKKGESSPFFKNKGVN